MAAVAAAPSAIISGVALSLFSDLELNYPSASAWPSPFAFNYRSCYCRRRRQKSGGRLECLSLLPKAECSAPVKREILHSEWNPKLEHPRRRGPVFPRYISPKFTSSSVVTSFSVIDGDGSEAGMSEEEKNAIVEFAGLSLDETEDNEDRSSESSEASSTGIREGRKLEPTSERTDEIASIEREADTYNLPRTGSSRHGLEIANGITLYMTLLERSASMDARTIAGAGGAVLERVEEEVGRLRGTDGINTQHLFEVLRIAKLLQVDLQLIGASRKSSTLAARLDETKTHCRQMLNIVTAL